MRDKAAPVVCFSTGAALVAVRRVNSPAKVQTRGTGSLQTKQLRTMCFMVVRPSPSIHLLDVRQLRQITPRHFYWARRRNFDESTVRTVAILTVHNSSNVRLDQQRRSAARPH